MSNEPGGPSRDPYAPPSTEAAPGGSKPKAAESLSVPLSAQWGQTPAGAAPPGVRPRETIISGIMMLVPMAGVMSSTGYWNLGVNFEVGLVLSVITGLIAMPIAAAREKLPLWLTAISGVLLEAGAFLGSYYWHYGSARTSNYQVVFSLLIGALPGIVFYLQVRKRILKARGVQV